MKPADAASRERALDVRSSFCVSAPAGSGKTELLTRRILRLLAECRMPEEILAITFTRKATAEMRHRLMELLLEAEHPGSSKDADDYRRQSLELAQAVLARDREQGWGLLQNPGRLRVSTIDSLCHWLGRSLPLLSGLGGLGGALQSVDDGAPHCAEALQYLLKEIEEDDETAEDFSLFASHLDNDWLQLEKMFGALMEKRLQWLRLLLPVGLHQSDAEESRALEALHRGVESLRCDMLSEARGLLRPYADQLSAATGMTLPEEGTAEEVAEWQSWCGRLLTKEGRWRKRVDSSALPDKEARKKLLALLDELRDAQLDPEALAALRLLPKAEFSGEQTRLLQAVTRLLHRAVGYLHIVFRERAEIDHNGVTLAALEALGAPEAPSELAMRLGCNIRHILVDEFQDTSQAQFMLLERLTAAWAEHNEQRPQEPHTLFLVGDAMQSCYGFRDANVGLFLQARERGIGGLQLEPLELRCNFRTQKPLVTWCNRNFAAVFPRAVDTDTGAAPFIPAVAVHDDADSAPAQLHLVRYESPQGSEAARREVVELAQQREAEWVVELAQQAQRENPQGVTAILLRSRTHARHIVPALQRAGVACNTEAMYPLAEQTVTQDLLSLSCALLDPWDHFSWLAILRAPWCGLDKRALYAVAGAAPDGASQTSLWLRVRNCETLDGLTADDRQRLRRFCAAVQPAVDGRARRSLRRHVEGVWFALGGPACLQTAAQLRQVQDFFSLLETLEGRELTVQELEEQAEQLYAAPEHPDACVQLMTMHKAKGLEFDTVILPCLDRKPRGTDRELLLGGQYLARDGEERPLMAVRAGTGADAEDEALYQWLNEREKRKSRLEKERLFYIACTRAIRRLHLLACVRTDQGGKDKKMLWDCGSPDKNSMAGILWEMERDGKLDAEFSDVCAQETPAEMPEPALRLQRLSADWSLPPPPPDMQRPPVRAGAAPIREGPAEDAPDVQQREATEENWLRHTGLVLHGALESIAREPARLDDAQWGQSMRSVWRAQLRQFGVPAAEMDACLGLVEEGLSKVRDDERGRWLLSTEHEQGEAEFSLQYLDPEGVLRTVRVDRCFIADGVRWIVDYKSARPAVGQSLKDFLEAAENRYKPQLQHYAQIFRRMEPERQLRTALYFPLLPQLHELPEA